MYGGVRHILFYCYRLLFVSHQGTKNIHSYNRCCRSHKVTSQSGGKKRVSDVAVSEVIAANFDGRQQQLNFILIVALETNNSRSEKAHACIGSLKSYI